MWYVCDVLYAVLYARVICFVVRGCAVWRRYINVCNCDMFSVVNVYLDHLQLCVLMVECFSFSECNVVSNECLRIHQRPYQESSIPSEMRNVCRHLSPM